MKRVLAILLVLATALSLAACGKKAPTPQETVPTSAATTAPTTESTAATSASTAATVATNAPTAATEATAATDAPTVAPTEKPSTAPATKATAKPTEKPTVKPTEKPTIKPTVAPTTKPTTKPTVKPTTAPTVKPTTAPTTKPTTPAETKPLQDGQWQSQLVIDKDLITLGLQFISDKDFLLTESYGKDFNQMPADFQKEVLADKEQAASLVKFNGVTYYIGAGGMQEGTYAIKGNTVTVTFPGSKPTTFTLERSSGDQLKVTALADPDGIFESAQLKAGVLFTWMEAPKHTHTWEDATCQAPKTCVECGATEGTAAGHNFVDSICTLCKVADFVDPTTTLKICGDTTEEYVSQSYSPESELTIVAPGLSFYNDGGYGEGVYCLLLSATFSADPADLDEHTLTRTPVTHNGKKYYRIGAGMSPAEVDMDDKEILITKDDGGTIKLIMLRNGNLRVTASTDSSYPENMILSTGWSYLK